MGLRRKSREAALQFLFQEDFAVQSGDSDTLADRFADFCMLYPVEKKSQEYALKLLKSTFAHKQQIDLLITEAATNWRLQRIAPIERNILRIAVCEMFDEMAVADQVAINEAVEIAKRFAGDESPSFINGVLDAVRRQLRNTREAEKTA